MPGFLALPAGAAAIAAQGLLTLSGYVVNLALARALGPAEFGAFGVVYSLLLAVELCARLGVPSAVIRLLATTAEPAPICRAASALALALALAATALFWAAAPLLARLLALPGGPMRIWLAGLDIVPFVFYLLWTAIATGLGRFGLAAWSTTSYALARAGFTVLSVLLAPGVEAALLANALASLVGLVPVALALGPSRLRPGLGPWRRILREALPPWFDQSLAHLLPLLGLWAIMPLAPGDAAAAAGRYSAALALARAPNSVALALGPLVLQRLSATAGGTGTPRAQRECAALATLAAFLLLPGCLVLALEARPLVLLLFGPEYGEAADLAALLALGVGLGHGALLLARNALFALGAPRAALSAVAGALLAQLAGLPLSVPRLGAPAAALVTTIALIAAAVAAVGATDRRLGGFLRLLPAGRLLALMAAIGLFSVSFAGEGPWLVVELALLGLIWASAGAFLGKRKLPVGSVFAGRAKG
ncbi:MAG: oligosaccharide flippase family protein [Geminicoccaceae bacterium]|nr:oligosaccharide flippase family protein [Geminicoccaceae bacterium]MDW8340471.1 oligosaccharide flippase family protein [Geminicoccaceae bacterium]